MQRWYQLQPKRLELEKELLKEAGFILDDDALRVRSRVEFIGSINDSKQDVAIRIVCFDGFPYRIPAFIAPALRLNPESRHISFRTHWVCLGLTVPNGWDFDNHIASLIEPARRVLIGQHTKEFGEEHRAPDRDLFGTQSAEYRVVIPEDFSTHPTNSVAKCELTRLDPKEKSVLLLTQVNDRRCGIEVPRGSQTYPADVFCLREMPIDFIRQLDDTFGNPTTIDTWGMLHAYALDTTAVKNLQKRLPQNKRRTFHLGVVFPFQENETIWQFFTYTTERGIGTTEFWATHRLSDLNVRISPSLDLKLLNKTRVLLVGAGAIGSTMALELACAGVGHIEICDFDRVAIGNIPRHEATLSELGQFKVEVVRNLIRSKNLSAKVTPVPINILEDPNFQERVRQASIVAVSVGDTNIERYINGVCVRAGVPAVYAYVGMHGSVGHVIRSIPKGRETGCLECFSRLYFTNESVIPRLPEAQDPNEVVVELGCNNPSLPGAGFDIKTVALSAVRKTIQTLARGSEAYPDDGADITVLATRAVAGTPYRSLYVNKFELLSNNNCSVCGQSANHPSF